LIIIWEKKLFRIYWLFGLEIPSSSFMESHIESVQITVAEEVGVETRGVSMSRPAL
jgi:hypothetical protein